MSAALALVEPDTARRSESPDERAPVIRRVLDASEFNRVANHPEVRPWLGGEGELDLSSTISATDGDGMLCNFALLAEGGGGFVLTRHEPGVYEVHSMFLPEARKATVAAMRGGLEYMFIRTDCERLITKVPDCNTPAASLARVGGFRPMFRREACWADGAGVSYLGLSLDDWAMANKNLEREGEWFHERLEEAKREAGSSLPVHPHDPAHERAVGAAVRMIRAGNVSKAVAFYNRWARFAGYAQILQLQDAPDVLDVQDAVIEVRGEDMEILQCR